MKKILTVILTVVGLVILSPSIKGECAPQSVQDGVYYGGSLVNTVDEEYKHFIIRSTDPEKTEIIKRCIDLLPAGTYKNINGGNIIITDKEHLMCVVLVEDGVIKRSPSFIVGELFNTNEIWGETWLDGNINVSTSISNEKLPRTILHEIGHSIDENDAISNVVITENDIEIISNMSRGIKEHILESKSEAFAEAFSLYFTDNQLLLQNIPELYKFIQSLMV